MRLILGILVAGLLFISIAVHAQDCAAVFEAALEAVDTLCDNTERNQACYGHSTLEATSYSDAGDFQFDVPGDLSAVTTIETLSLSALNVEAETWGVAVMQLQADLPDTIPGQNVTIIMFGDVTIRNAVEPLVEVPVTANSGVNVRSRPNSNANNVVASLRSGQEVMATGRLPDNSWIRIRFDYDENTTIEGWVSADFLNGDTSVLKAVEPDAAVYTSMQAFYLRTGIGGSACDEIPGSGMLIQTPEGVGQIELSINEVEILLGSTIYVQAAEGEMRVYALEGLVTVRAHDVIQRVPPGTVSILTLDPDGSVNSSPQYPVPYNFETVVLLNPLLGMMPQVIEAPPAVAPEEVASAVAAVAQEAAVASGSAARIGTYRWTIVESNATCWDPRALGTTATWYLEFTEDSLLAGLRNVVSLSNPSPGVYVITFSTDVAGGTNSFTYRVLSSERVEYTTERVNHCPDKTVWIGTRIGD